jgi:hypothetical protein
MHVAKLERKTIKFDPSSSFFSPNFGTERQILPLTVRIAIARILATIPLAGVHHQQGRVHGSSYLAQLITHANSATTLHHHPRACALPWPPHQPFHGGRHAWSFVLASTPPHPPWTSSSTAGWPAGSRSHSNRSPPPPLFSCLPDNLLSRAHATAPSLLHTHGVMATSRRHAHALSYIYIYIYALSVAASPSTSPNHTKAWILEGIGIQRWTSPTGRCG